MRPLLHVEGQRGHKRAAPRKTFVILASKYVKLELLWTSLKRIIDLLRTFIQNTLNYKKQETRKSS